MNACVVALKDAVVEVGVALLEGSVDAAVVTGTVGRFDNCTVGEGDGVVGGATRCGDSGGCDESSSIEEILPWAWL